jgi:hypothetical protein
MKNMIALCLILALLAACVPSASEPNDDRLEAADLIVWNAPSSKLEGVLLTAIRTFDPSLEDARGIEVGNHREVTSLGLERRKITIFVGETVTGTLSFFTLENGSSDKAVPDFATRLEQAMYAACDANLMRRK